MKAMGLYIAFLPQIKNNAFKPIAKKPIVGRNSMASHMLSDEGEKRFKK
jgi:hypothetical protein